MQKTARFALVALVVGLAVPAAAAHAAIRMPIGFFDDSSFRFSPAREQNLADAAATGASVIHTTADWATIAPTKPADPSDGNDPAYKLGDLDELVFQSGLHGLRVMIDITGTPKWANGNKTPNNMPTRLSDLTTFSKMLATRYNGHSGFGIVGLWAVWNEPNIQLFLTPQFVGQEDRRPCELRQAPQGGVCRDQGGQPARQGRRRRDVRAWPRQAAGGRQRQRRTGHVRAAARPGERAEVRRLGAPPVPDVAEPSAAAEGAVPERDPLDVAELREDPQGRRSIAPSRSGSPSTATRPSRASRTASRPPTQAKYAKQALTVAKADPNVQMFIWFVFRDSSGNPWQSGLELASGAHKPAFAAFSAVAKLTDGQTVTARAGKAPAITIYVPYLSHYSATGTQIGVFYTVYDGTKSRCPRDADRRARDRPVREVHAGLHAREEAHVHDCRRRERAERPLRDAHDRRQRRVS